MVVGGVLLLLLLWARGRGEARRDTDDGDAAAGYTQQYYLIIFVIRNKLQLHAGICVPGMYGSLYLPRGQPIFYYIKSVV